VAAFLVERGHAVRAVARDARFVGRLAAVGCGARRASFGPDFNPLLVMRLRAEFAAWPAHAVLVNVAKDLRIGGVAARLAGVPVVQRIGAQGDMTATAKIRLVDRFVHPAYLTNCLDIRDRLLQKLPFLDAARIAVQYPGKRVLDAPPGEVGDPLRLVTTNQLVAGKAMPDLLAALAALAGEGFAFSLDVVGSGDQEPPLRAQAAELGIAERVRWHGFQEDVAAFLRRADVFCLPSTHEGMPQGLLEAMAHGLAPVARAVGGIPEVWPESLGELLAEPGAGAASLTVCLRRVFAAGSERVAAMRRAAWEKARADLNRDVQFARLEQWLASVARPGPNPDAIA
jgi:glycosyltransferase involved in cell wall biosynthesis